MGSILLNLQVKWLNIVGFEGVKGEEIAYLENIVFSRLYKPCRLLWIGVFLKSEAVSQTSEFLTSKF